MNMHRFQVAGALLALATLSTRPCAIRAASAPASLPTPRPALIVVEDRGGVPAQPYYDDLGLPVRSSATADAPQRLPLPGATTGPRGEAAMLPVRSGWLTPGVVERRPLQASGLTPFFVIGDDARSREWLQQRLVRLRELHASGLVVNVASPQALDALRRLAPGMTLSPASGDNLAQRLGLRHYPVLVTATGIEQ